MSDPFVALVDFTGEDLHFIRTKGKERANTQLVPSMMHSVCVENSKR